MEVTTPQGGYSSFFLIRRLGSSIYRSPPKKYQEYQAPPKNIRSFSNLKISQFCTFDLKKTLKCIKMNLKLAQFCDDPQKYPQNLHTPQKIFIFLKTPKIIEIQNFEPPKNNPSLRENIRVWAQHSLVYIAEPWSLRDKNMLLVLVLRVYDK